MFLIFAENFYFFVGLTTDQTKSRSIKGAAL